MRCPQPDWLDHRLTVSGPAEALAAFRAAAAGAGAVPWVVDHDALEEDIFHRLLAPPPEARGISLAGARILARQVREMAWAENAAAVAACGHSRACPFDLHALVPVPWPILRLGPDHPEAIAWLFAHWGPTWPLRRVASLGPDPRVGGPSLRYAFWAADWSPWPALRACRARWPMLRFRLGVEYWWEAAPAPRRLIPPACPASHGRAISPADPG